MDTTRNEVIKIGNLLYQKNYIAGTEGNISIRISDDKILTTKSGVCKGNLCSEDLVLVNHAGEPIEGDNQPSIEFKMHLEVYKNRPEIKAIIHAHPLFVISLSLAGLNFEKQYLPESVIMLGKVPVAKYARPSTGQVPKSIKPYLEKTDIIIMDRHGSLTFGKTLKEAFYKTEILEKTAKIIWLSSRVGPLIPLDPLEIKELLKLRNEVYGLNFPIL
jgi:L-fuculose-phosphate aldolase